MWPRAAAGRPSGQAAQAALRVCQPRSQAARRLKHRQLGALLSADGTEEREKAHARHGVGWRLDRLRILREGSVHLRQGEGWYRRKKTKRQRQRRQ